MLDSSLDGAASVVPVSDEGVAVLAALDSSALEELVSSVVDGGALSGALDDAFDIESVEVAASSVLGATVLLGSVTTGPGGALVGDVPHAPSTRVTDVSKLVQPSERALRAVTLNQLVRLL